MSEATGRTAQTCQWQTDRLKIQMAAFALSELLPNKWRHIGVVIADSTTMIAVIIGPVTGRYGIESHTWQWNFWGAAIAQFISFLGLLFLYYPPAHP